MKTLVKIEGFKELDAALQDLTRATARNVAMRALKRAADPIREDVARMAPRQRGKLAQSIAVSARVKNTVGNAEFSAALRAGLGKDAAVAAMRDARRAVKGSSSLVQVAIGPRIGVGVIRYAHIAEFGSRKMAAQPYMRPAWDSGQDRALAEIRASLSDEIKKAVARAERKAARLAAKIAAGK